MDVETKIGLIKQVGEEIVTEEELRELLSAKQHPIAYDGFEPSGTDIHIAQGVLRAININKMTRAGIKFKILVADWHAWANNKMGGDLEKISFQPVVFIFDFMSVFSLAEDIAAESDGQFFPQAVFVIGTNECR